MCARFLSLDRGWVIIIFGTSTLFTCRDASVLQKAHAAIGEEDDDKMTEKILDIVRGDARRRRLAKQVLFRAWGSGFVDQSRARGSGKGSLSKESLSVEGYLVGYCCQTP